MKAGLRLIVDPSTMERAGHSQPRLRQAAAVLEANEARIIALDPLDGNNFAGSSGKSFHPLTDSMTEGSRCSWPTVEDDVDQTSKSRTERIIAIGDIHGESSALARLIETIGPTHEDTIVVLGDVIDRGSDSRGVIDQLIGLDRHCTLILLMGNHEEMLVAALEERDDRTFWLMFGGQNTLDSYGIKSGDPNEIPRSHLDFLKQGRQYFECDTHFFVHASYDPIRPLDQQSSSTLLWEKIDPADARPHISGKIAVLGHTPQSTMLDLGFLKCIDTGCGYGGPLTGLDVSSGTLFEDRGGRAT